MKHTLKAALIVILLAIPADIRSAPEPGFELEVAEPTELVELTAEELMIQLAVTQAALQRAREKLGEESETELVDLLEQGGKTVADWKAVGWIAALTALITFLMNLLRFGPLDEWMTLKKIRWTKPYISAGLGALLGGFSAYQAGAGLWPSITAGIIAGFSAIGFHETTKRRKVEHRSA